MPTDITSPDGCTTWSLDFTLCEDWATFSPAVTGVAAAVAVSNLYYLTGARFGACNKTYRPCAQRVWEHWSTYDRGVLGWHGTWGGRSGSISLDHLTGSSLTGVACASCVDPGLAQLTLPSYPINEVVSMTEDGVAVDVSKFAIDRNRTIIRQDGLTFPADQDITSPVTDPGTWSITVNVGQPLPDILADIAPIYACELAKHLSDIDCALPDTVISVQRQGINYEFATPEFIERGLIGHKLIDTVILRLNPSRLQSRPTVASVDTLARQPYRETWTGSAP